MINSKVLIENAQVVLENGIIWDGAILIENGIIQKICHIQQMDIPSNKNIKGINMEGPYMNTKYGAWKNIDTWYSGKIDEKHYKTMVDELGDAVKLWTIAPEREGIMPFVEMEKILKNMPM